ncbi:MAG: YdbH domain-containing protein, partial [Sphingomonas bacterium]
LGRLTQTLPQQATGDLAAKVDFWLKNNWATVSADVSAAGVSNVSADSASGARLTLALSPGRIDGEARLSGGGFPATRIAVRQGAADAPVSGTATIAPYAGLALTPVEFAGTAKRLRLRTVATLSGPLGDGSVETLRAPLAATIGTDGLTINPGCTPVAFGRIAASGLTLRPARITLCATGPALLSMRGDRIDYGARIAPLRLDGAIGSSPLAFTADSIALRGKGFEASGVKVRIGPADRPTAPDFARVEGSFNGGTFHGGSGRIGAVPLLLGEADGKWRFADSALNLSGALTVRDADPAQRFLPLAARDVTLRLADGVITVGGVLREPKKGVKVADVTIRHTLASGKGSAHLAVPGIAFGKDFQPEELTPVTYGVIADVNGTVTGEGDIAWDGERVTSTGTFRTAGTDLAAAFGPVTGIKGEIRFTDLLALESAPGQVATVASINPGVPVEGGRIVYQTLAGTRIRIEGARWPFAGGELTLDPATLDFSAPEAHRLTFRVKGAEAAQFLQQFDFKNLDATGTFDGMLPIAFDQSGGRIEGGHLVAREGGGGIAYVGELTEKDLGTWGNIAFQALKSLRYKSLDIVMDGPLAGEMVTEVRFAGVSQGEGAKSNFLIRRLQKLPFVFNVRIKAPFRGLLDSVASFYDPRRLIERNLPALIEQQHRQAVQPQESEKMP